MYALYGITVNGMVLGVNMAAPSTLLNPLFFGPQPEFVAALKGMLWSEPKVQGYLLSLGL